jgi:hypothetical protein
MSQERAADALALQLPSHGDHVQLEGARRGLGQCHETRQRGLAPFLQRGDPARMARQVPEIRLRRRGQPKPLGQTTEQLPARLQPAGFKRQNTDRRHVGSPELARQ